MSTAAFHYREAERLADAYREAHRAVEQMTAVTAAQAEDRRVAAISASGLLSKAQVHATLALAGATFLADKQQSYSDAHDQLANAVTGDGR